MSRIAPLALVCLSLVAIGSDRKEPPTAPPANAPDTAASFRSIDGVSLLAPDGATFLAKHQSDDGAWRSDVYATFKDGTALTPLVLVALQADADSQTKTEVDFNKLVIGCSIQPMVLGSDSAAARARGSAWLAKFATADGTIVEPKGGFPYPVYTAALSVIALSHAENADHVKARNAWLEYLLARQLTGQNGWKPEDKQFGGWGYYPRIPTKPTAGEFAPARHLLESNLSATTVALEALRAAGHADAMAYREALSFVERCQNEDGGFHFIHDDPVRNKAGAVDPTAETKRFRSYGSATADGLRAVLAAKPEPGAESKLARDWLVKHFAADRHPGDYLKSFEPNRDAVFFYYAASVAKALRIAEVKELDGTHWADRLTNSLLAKQRPDGSWVNDRDQQRENDPIVATAHAVTALAECRKAKK